MDSARPFALSDNQFATTAIRVVTKSLNILVTVITLPWKIKNDRIRMKMPFFNRLDESLDTQISQIVLNTNVYLGRERFTPHVPMDEKNSLQPYEARNL